MGKKYVMSDLHGCYDAYMAMLDKINFGDSDTLYVLGDAVDRGPDGIKLLLDIMNRENVIMLLGNHDYSADTFLRLYAEKPELLENKEIKAVMDEWLSDGGEVTFRSFEKLDADMQKKLIQFLGAIPLRKVVEANERKFLLAHTVPALDEIPDEGFDKDGNMIIPPVRNIDPEGFIMGEPDYEAVYNPGYFIVTGHTPTGFIDESFAGRIWKGNRHIAIDCGAAFGHALGCLCLDTMEEFYVKTERMK